MGDATDARQPRPLAVDAVLFDLDGTLVDTAPDLVRAVNRVRVDRGLVPLPFAELRPFASHGARGLLAAGMAVTPADGDYAALRDAFLAHYAAALCIESAMFDEMERLLAAIELRAMPWGIVTNKATRFTTPLLEALGLSERAATVVCGDTTPHAKPHPAPLLHAAAELGVVPARCVYVGDAQRDIEAGIAAGMHTIVARYGYIQPDELPDTWPADGHITDPSALIAWLPERAARRP
jgi:N-acetyl-D-muramate 6-phosphate phosphatase